MPPIVPRKRLHDSPTRDEAAENTGANQQSPGSAAKRRKTTLYDDLDATATPQSSSLLHGLDGDDDSSSLSSLSDEEFEDVPPPRPPEADESADEDDDMEFEDVAAPSTLMPDAPVSAGDLELTLHRDTRMSLTNQYGDKKGRTKREKMVRNATHGLHVLLLLWHNAVRNSWLCDMEVQATMISHLPPRLWDEVDRWRRNSGLVKDTPAEPAPKGRGKRQAEGKGKGKGKTAKEKSRDWSSAAEKLEEGVVDMSHGDPLFRLMQSLCSWWKQRFKVTAPGLRKRGYMSLERLDRLTKAHKKSEHDPELFGEKISGLEEFRRCARSCRGSRDVGAQLFTALLRGLGLEARMVANLQTLGFGWNKLEDADPETQKEIDKTSEMSSVSLAKKEDRTHPTPTKLVSNKKKKDAKVTTSPPSTRKAKQSQSVPIVVDDSDELDLEYKDTDDESIVELEAVPKRAAQPARRFDSDLEYPHYWTEVLSPVTQKYLPVDPIVKGIVATNRELIESLEPRGAKADKARQMIAYVVGYSPDGTARDVTVRYLKKQVFPGRTKGARMPLEKMPVYNRHGKIKRYEHFDWFKTAMSGYRRGRKSAPLTEVDEAEDSTDLKPAQPEKKEVKEGQETLQYYKQSKEFVLQRHLKREEALRPGAKSVKIFKNKVRGGKIEEEEVYLRSDVLNVKSAETWHKQGRAPLAGEEPLKRVPYRAATLNRRREIMEAEAATGQKVLQGLYSLDQTDWIIPPPIKDGIIPKNEYGNIDLFAEHMCPEGAAHVPFRGAVKVCKRLQIDYAEAVVDFEFGHRMAVPVIQGVVIAEEHHDRVMEELQKDEAERVRKEDEKRRKAALGKWRKFLMGMRIVERIRQDYGEVDESVSVFGHSRGGAWGKLPPKPAEEEQLAGGFLPEGYEEDEDDDAPAHQTSGFFATAAGDEDGPLDDDLVMEDHRQQDPAHEPPKTPEEEPLETTTRRRASRGTVATKRKPASKKKPARPRRKAASEDEDEEDDESWESDALSDE
ncbi:DNA repair protein-like protein [Hapsidospora chrysogenum ATCC 11550]|uniref:DNA repair protein-like protein n=1 Tax=Hapsidospora chrysogenum (strain ATCC 11550 / CBS 779.69 / DSM 880 / IAM 14645 / JCM 23072 / IMI 49137) TaxID=857340 RepID=A0A086T765_HAPC1|nr:DNA repair protein-like protein [Hapsidospora chrysogenum ATCC 11550]